MSRGWKTHEERAQEDEADEVGVSHVAAARVLGARARLVPVHSGLVAAGAHDARDARRTQVEHWAGRGAHAGARAGTQSGALDVERRRGGGRGGGGPGRGDGARGGHEAGRRVVDWRRVHVRLGALLVGGLLARAVRHAVQHDRLPVLARRAPAGPQGPQPRAQYIITVLASNVLIL